MSTNEAKRFIVSIQNDIDLRNRLNQVSRRNELYSVLKNASFDFSYQDFDEAYLALLIKCQTQYQADNLQELKKWWEMLHLLISD